MAKPEIYYQKDTILNQKMAKLAFTRYLTSTFLLKCPVCAQGKIFKNFFELKTTCPSCNSRLERDTGSSILSGLLSYLLAMVLTLLIIWPLIAAYGLFNGITFVCLGIVAVLVFLLHRPSKGTYLWMLWYSGLIYPDNVASQTHDHVNPRKTTS